MRIPGSRVLTLAALMLFFAMMGCTQEPEEDRHPLGSVQFDISCSDEARPAFNRAVALLHHMTYPQAKDAFERVAELDPECALAHWGIAMTLFQPLWPTRPGPEDLQQGWHSVQRALALALPTRRERLYIAAVEAFFRDPQEADYWERIRRWEQAMETLYQGFPDDLEAKAFYTLAHLATSQLSGNALEQNSRAAEIALSIHQANPLHPGAIHYLIHANDIQGRAQESLDIVRSYDAIAPRNPHALHMPTHIFTRLGYWQDVIEGNHNAAEAALEHPAGQDGQYVWDEFPHAIEYLVYAYLQQGEDAAAAAQLERMHATESLHPTFKTAFHLSSGPARYALERRAWEESAALVPRAYDALDWDRFPWPEAVTWFARGLGSARLGNLEEARHAHERLQALEDAADEAGEQLFTRQILIMRLGVSAWIAHGDGLNGQALDLMHQAAELEVTTPKHPVTPAPTLPAHELLGELLLQQGDHREALVAFERSLASYPQRFNSLLGAARSAQALEDTTTAKKYYGALLEIADGSNRPEIEEARTHRNKGL